MLLLIFIKTYFIKSKDFFFFTLRHKRFCEEEKYIFVFHF